MGGALFTRELFGQSPVGIVALKDAVAGGDHGVQSTEIAESVFRFELGVSGEDLAGGVILKADQGELGVAAFQSIMTAGDGRIEVHD
jgi:hypothetical protein